MKAGNIFGRYVITWPPDSEPITSLYMVEET